jgi:hypothetical protein
VNLLQIHQRPDVYLVVAAVLLAMGVYGLIRRRTLIGMLIAGELIFSAASAELHGGEPLLRPDPRPARSSCSSSWDWPRPRSRSP